MTYLGLVVLLLLPMIVEAQAIAIGSRVQTTTSLNVRSTPSGAYLGQQPKGALGTVKAGPQVANFGGKPVTWWQINFDTGVDGWCGAGLLKVVASSSYPGAAVAKATPVTVVSWTLQWTDAAVGNGAVFEIERATAASGPFARIATVNEGTTTYEDRAVVVGQRYWYRVREVKGTTPSPYGTVVSTP
jgi:uncharacterized protein YgiM (DUF1202 family)